jgi:hypothetical protein
VRNAVVKDGAIPFILNIGKTAIEAAGLCIQPNMVGSAANIGTHPGAHIGRSDRQRQFHRTACVSRQGRRTHTALDAVTRQYGRHAGRHGRVQRLLSGGRDG